MSTRNLLHKEKLEQFIAFLDSKDVEHREGKGDWEVIQVYYKSHIKGLNPSWCVIHTKMRGDHLSVPRELVNLVRKFIKSEYNISWQSK